MVGAALAPMRIDLTPTWHQEVDILGMRSHGVEDWEGVRMSSYQRVVRWLADGRIKLAGMVTHRFPLTEYRKAFSLAAAKDKQRNWSLKVAFEFT